MIPAQTSHGPRLVRARRGPECLCKGWVQDTIQNRKAHPIIYRLLSKDPRKGIVRRGKSLFNAESCMTDQITLTLPTEILQRAEQLARCTGRSIDQLLAETIELSLRPLGTSSDDIAECSDELVLDAADDPGLSSADDRRLSELLHRQQAGILAEMERPELTGLMEVYQTQLLRKAQALREAVRRGLRPPLQP